ALAALARLLSDVAAGGGAATAAVVDIDWVRFAAALPPGRVPPLLSALLGDGAGAAAEGARLARLPPAQRRAELAALVRARATALEGPRRVAEMGLASPMAVGRGTPRARGLDRPLRATLLSDQRTLDALVPWPDAELAATPATTAALALAANEEPIAIVGVAC